MVVKTRLMDRPIRAEHLARVFRDILPQQKVFNSFAVLAGLSYSP